LKALENARQKAYKVRAEKATIKKAKNESKKTEEVSIEFQKSLPVDPEDDSKVDPKDVLPENEKENIRDEKESEPVAEESHIERIERHAERQEFNDHINNLIDERVQYKPIVKSKYKLVNGVYVIR
jgi:recombinational DNA repair protein RecT